MTANKDWHIDYETKTITYVGDNVKQRSRGEKLLRTAAGAEPQPEGMTVQEFHSWLAQEGNYKNGQP